VPTSAQPPDAAEHRIGIDRKVGFLSRPNSYPEGTRAVETIETHYSWVFLTDRHAYKVKKPVQEEGFDFRSLEGRRRNAIAELRLNRRLAPDVYLRSLPLTAEADGSLALGGRGRPVDWLVQMVRLDTEHMFDRRLLVGDWRYAEIEGLAQRLAGFFATARRVHLSPPQLRRRISREITATRAAFRGEARFAALLTPTARRLDAFLCRRWAMFRRRLSEHRLVDGHGDLRPEHIYLRDTPRIIDCLEFRADLRQLDPPNELAYLGLECRRLGGLAIEERLLRRYSVRTGDRPPPDLVRFYTALNALVRARIAIRHLAEPGARPATEWRRRAAGYLATAARESGFLSR
jgi:uncharacterized protein